MPARAIPTPRGALNVGAGHGGKGDASGGEAAAVENSTTPTIAPGQSNSPIPGSIYVRQLQTPNGRVSVAFSQQNGKFVPTAIRQNQTFSQPIAQSSNGYNISGSIQETYGLQGNQLVSKATGSSGTVSYGNTAIANFSGPNATLTPIQGASVSQPIYGNVPGASSNQYLGTVTFVPTVANNQLSLGFSAFAPSTFNVTSSIPSPTSPTGKIGVTTQYTSSFNQATGTVTAGGTSATTNLLNAQLANLSIPQTPQSVVALEASNAGLSSTPAVGSPLYNSFLKYATNQGIGTTTVSSTLGIAGNVPVYSIGPPTQGTAPLTIAQVNAQAVAPLLTSGSAAASSGSPFSLISNTKIDQLQQSNTALTTRTGSLTLSGLFGSTETPTIQRGAGLSLLGTESRELTVSSLNIAPSGSKTVPPNGFTSVITNPYGSLLNFFTVTTTESKTPPANATLQSLIGGPNVNIFTSTPSTFTTSVKSNNPVLSSYNYQISTTAPTTGFENILPVQKYIQSQENNPKGPQGNGLVNFAVNSASSLGNIGANLYSPTATVSQRATAAGTVAVVALAAPIQLGLGGVLAGGVASASEIPASLSVVASSPAGAFGNVAFTTGSSLLGGKLPTAGEVTQSAVIGLVAGPILTAGAGEILGGFPTTKGFVNEFTGKSTAADISNGARGTTVFQTNNPLGKGEVIASSTPTGFSILKANPLVDVQAPITPIPEIDYPISPTQGSPEFLIGKGVTQGKSLSVAINENLPLNQQEAAYQSLQGKVAQTLYYPEPAPQGTLALGPGKSVYSVTGVRLPTTTSGLSTQFLTVFEPTERGTQTFISGSATQEGAVSSEASPRGFMNQGNGEFTISVTKQTPVRSFLGLKPVTTDIKSGTFTVQPATTEISPFEGRTNLFTRDITAGNQAVNFNLDTDTGTSLILNKPTTTSLGNIKQTGFATYESGVREPVTIIQDIGGKGSAGHSIPAKGPGTSTLIEGTGGTFSEQLSGQLQVGTAGISSEQIIRSASPAPSGGIGLQLTGVFSAVASPQQVSSNLITGTATKQATQQAPTTQTLTAGIFNPGLSISNDRQAIRTDPLLIQYGGVITNLAQRNLAKPPSSSGTLGTASAKGSTSLSGQLQAVSNPYSPSYATQTSKLPNNQPPTHELPGLNLPGSILITRFAPAYEASSKSKIKQQSQFQIIPPLEKFAYKPASAFLEQNASDILNLTSIRSSLSKATTREATREGLLERNAYREAYSEKNAFAERNAYKEGTAERNAYREATKQLEKTTTPKFTGPGEQTFGLPEFGLPFGAGGRKPKIPNNAKTAKNSIPKFGYVSDLTHASLGLHGNKASRTLARAGLGLSRPLL